MRPSNLVVVVVLVVAALVPWARHGLDWPDTLVANLDHCPQVACDFVGHYLVQARMLSAGQGEVHSGWFYPPLPAILFQAFLPLGDRAAVATWTGLNLVAAAGLAGFTALPLRRGLPAPMAAAGALALVSISLPVLHSIKWGQVSLLLALGGLWALSGGGRGRGAMLGLLGAVKVMPLTWLAAPLVGRRWRLVAEGVIATAVLGVGLPLLVLGRDALPFFQRVLDARALQPGPLGGQALTPALTRWLVDGTHIGGPLGVPPLLLDAPLLAAALSVVGPLVLVGLTLARLRDRRPSLHAAALTLLAFTLALPPGWHHYFAFLPVAQAVALGGGRPAGRVLALASVALSTAPIVLLGPDTYRLASTAGLTTLSALAAWAALLATADGEVPALLGDSH